MDDVSIVIPTKNAGRDFRQTLEAIYAQDVPFRFEVVVVDSGSTDETLSICEEFPVRVLTIPPEEFGHGRTRNYAIRSTQGEIVVLTVQDAWPADSLWLRNLIRPLEQDPRVVGAYSRQIPKPGTDPFTRRMFSIWGVSSCLPVVREISDRVAYDQLPWEEKAHFCAFSNVSSAIRRSVWREIPFPDIEYAEDLAWARMVLEQGYRLVYAPDSVVIHSHHHSWTEKLQRAYVDGKVVPQIFNADLPFPGDAVVQAVANLIYKELQRSILHEALCDLALNNSGSVRALSPNGIAYITSEYSPWMPGDPARRKKEVLLDVLVERHVPNRHWQRTLYHRLGLYWIKFLSIPALDRMLYWIAIKHFSHTLAQMWGPWILFWAMLTARVGTPIPLDLSNRLLGYMGQFLPAADEELPEIWLNVLVDVGGKFLGKAAWAAASNNAGSEALRRIERWTMGEASRP